MSERKIKRIPKEEAHRIAAEREELNQREKRASLALLWLLVRQHPEDAKRFVERVKAA